MVDAVFDEPNLIGSAGLVPVMRLADRAGLHKLLRERLSVPSANASVKAGQPDPGGAGEGGSSLDKAGTRQHCQMARVRRA